MSEGSSPILSYNYGARRPIRVRKAGMVMGAMILAYSAVIWSIIILEPRPLIRIFSSDAQLIKDAVPALNQYFAAFIFMDLQYMGQTVFKSLNKKRSRRSSSQCFEKYLLWCRLLISCPMHYIWERMESFWRSPVSNVIGGTLCFATMLITVLPELKRMEKVL